MSLDVYLSLPGSGGGMNESGIFVRENGQMREMTRAEWDERYPGREPFVLMSGDSDEVYAANITHNLWKMADEAGLYEALWRPDEHNLTVAAQLIPSLTTGLAMLRADPSRFEAMNPSNGWGSYGVLVSFVEAYLAACQEHPDAIVRVSR